MYTIQAKKGWSRATRAGMVGWIVLFIVVWVACTSKDEANIPDVSDIRIDLDITRFEQLLLNDSLIDAAGIEKIKSDHPAFSEVYFQHIIPGAEEIMTIDDPELQMQEIRSWIRHPRTRWLYDTVQQIYPDITPLKEELTSAFRYAKYYFPEKETPRFYTTLSDFGYFPFIYAEDSLKDGIGISLEMFLGEKFPYLQYTALNNAFSDYLTRSYNKEHIVRRTLEVWIDDLAGPPPGERLLDIMIHNGKKLYVLEQLMPTAEDSVIMDYSSEKLKWIQDNEKNVWYHFSTQDMLYETSMGKIRKYIGPSPNSPGMPAESPGNSASWLGWQIVKAYMRKHPQTSLKELLALQDAQKIMDESGYRPPR